MSARLNTRPEERLMDRRRPENDTQEESDDERREVTSPGNAGGRKNHYESIRFPSIAADCLRWLRKIHFLLLFKAVTFFSGVVLALISIAKSRVVVEVSSLMVDDCGELCMPLTESIDGFRSLG